MRAVQAAKFLASELRRLYRTGASATLVTNPAMMGPRLRERAVCAALWVATLHG